MENQELKGLFFSKINCWILKWGIHQEGNQMRLQGHSNPSVLFLLINAESGKGCVRCVYMSGLPEFREEIFHQWEFHRRANIPDFVSSADLGT